MIAHLAATHAASQGIAVPSIRWLSILPPIIMIGGAVVLSAWPRWCGRRCGCG